MGKFRIAILLLCAAQFAQAAKVRSLDVRILSTMLAGDEGFGEWGFSALVVADGHKILFDTGAHPDAVLRNLRALKMNLSDVPDAILSHNHLDHTAGLLTLRQEYRKLNSGALVNTHVGKGILLSRFASAPWRGRPELVRREASTVAVSDERGDGLLFWIGVTLTASNLYGLG